MNVPFRLADATLDEPFLKGSGRPWALRAEGAPLRGRLPGLDLQRHADEGVAALRDFMLDFAKKHGGK